MNKYLNKPIKEVITEFPKVARILEDYNIGCVPCKVGTCLLKDVVSVHGLEGEQEAEMLWRTEKAIYPERNPQKPKVSKSETKPVNKEFKYSPPIKRLVDEHLLIKRWIKLIPLINELILSKPEFDAVLIKNGMNFIRSYADKFHHAKEEDILFKYTDESSEIIKTMLEDHATARGYVKQILQAIDGQDKTAISKNLSAYGELLTEHIKKEDEILYPWIDKDINVSQVGELFGRFEEADKATGKETEKENEAFISQLEAKLINKGGLSL